MVGGGFLGLPSFATQQHRQELRKQPPVKDTINLGSIAGMSNWAAIQSDANAVGANEIVPAVNPKVALVISLHGYGGHPILAQSIAEMMRGTALHMKSS